MKYAARTAEGLGLFLDAASHIQRGLDQLSLPMASLDASLRYSSSQAVRGIRPETATLADLS